jgi:radical SAM protein with 4Fe4S-binding SPASM domain
LWRSQLVKATRVPREFGVARLRLLAVNTLRTKLFHREIRCRHPWEVAVLDLDGNLRPCMNWAGESSMGNCLQQSYAQIWAGDAYCQLRDELTGRAPLRHTCRHCHALSSGRVDDDTAFEQVPL